MGNLTVVLERISSMPVVTETAAPLNNSIDAVRIELRVRPADFDGETIAQRFQARVRYMVIRDDGREGELRWTDWTHVDDTISTFVSGDAAALRNISTKLYNQGLIDLDL